MWDNMNPSFFIATPPDHAISILSLMTVLEEREKPGGRCFVGTVPSREGFFGVLIAKDPVRMCRSKEYRRASFVLTVPGVPASELDIDELRVSLSSMAYRTRKALTALDWLVAERIPRETPDWAKNDPEVAEIERLLADIG